LSHDHTTLPTYAYERLAAGESMAGVIIVPGRVPIGQAIDEILVANDCSEQHEWRGLVRRFPI
jgi:hypothetical protein